MYEEHCSSVLTLVSVFEALTLWNYQKTKGLDFYSSPINGEDQSPAKASVKLVTLGRFGFGV